MRIAARLALHAPQQGCGALDEYVRGPASKYLLGYHGCDILVRDISESGFSADVDAEIPLGAVVRLRLPGAGVIVARVADCSAGRVSAVFVNPVSAARLRMTLGMGRVLAA
jgi:hypothetical protein